MIRSSLTRTPSRSRTVAAAAVLTGLTLALTACGSDEGDPFAESGDSSASGETITVGGANFTEMQIMQAMYVALLEDAGFTTETVTVDTREIYYPELANGNVSVVPEYAATMAEYLNVGANGADAAPIATNDATETVEAARSLAEADGVDILDPAEAADQNGFAVTTSFAEENDLSTLTDLGELGQPLVFATSEECPTRPFCQPGLEETYGLEFESLLPTGFGEPATKQAVQSGEAQLGLVATTDATLEQFDLVLLEDDKKLQLADNLVPAVNAEVSTPELTEALNQLAGVLTTEDLTELNQQVDGERQQAGDVAEAYLTEKGLIEG